MSHVHRVGLDIGFGQTKAVSDTGAHVVFPTAVAPRREHAVDLGDYQGVGAAPSGYATRDGTVCDVGETALGRALPTRSADFLLRYAPVLAAHACERLGGPPPTELCVGLPLAYYTQYREQYTEVLSEFSVNGSPCRPRVWCIPQGVGVLVDWLYDETGRPHADRADATGLILDIGFNTIDAVAFSRGTVDAGETHMFDHAGVSKIVSNLTAYIQREFGYRPSQQKAHEIFLEQTLKLNGERHTLQHAIKRLVDSYFEEFFFLLEDTWGARLHEYDYLLIAGGGAHHVVQYIPQRFAGQVVYMRPAPEFSNARGFLKTLLKPRQRASASRTNGRTRSARGKPSASVAAEEVSHA